MPSDLVGFLLARIAEDEARFAVDDDELAAVLRPAPNPLWQGDDGYIVLLHVRLLAECDAKRQIVEGYQQAEADDDMEMTGSVASWNDGYVCGQEYALKCLALPYAGHDDYRQEWKP